MRKDPQFRESPRHDLGPPRMVVDDRTRVLDPPGFKVTFSLRRGHLLQKAKITIFSSRIASYHNLRSLLRPGISRSGDGDRNLVRDRPRLARKYVAFGAQGYPLISVSLAARERGA